jgi:hypothetical protein
MGYNAAVEICLDGLDQIRNNPLQFTERLCTTISKLGASNPPKPVSFAVGNHCNPAAVFHLAHMDEHVPYLIGGNTVYRFPDAAIRYGGYVEESKVLDDWLKRMADAAGYRLVKKNTKKN